MSKAVAVADIRAWPQVGRFLAAGATGYAVNLSFFAVGIHDVGLDYRVSAVVAFGAALAATFALNRRFTFGIRGPVDAPQAMRYVIVSLAAFATNLAVLHGLVSGVGVAKLLGQAVAVAVAAPVNYTGQRLWAFAPERAIPTRRAVWVALGAIVAGAAVLRFRHLGTQGFEYDEAVTSWLLRARLSELVPTVARTESTPPLYYLLAWGWMHLAGNTEAGLRSLSAIAGVATVPAAFAAARALAGNRIALVAAALVAVNPFLIWYSQEARAYSLLVLTTTLTLWLFARARANPTRWRVLAWGLCGSLALCTHYFAVFPLAIEALLLRRRWIGLLPLGATAVGLFALASRQAGEHKRWFTLIPLPHRALQLVTDYLVGFTPPATTAMVVAGVVPAVLALVLLLARGVAMERRAAAIAALVAAGAALVPLGLAVAGVDYFNIRNVIAGLVPAAIVVACGLGARRAGAAGLVVAGALVAVSLGALVAMERDPAAQRPAWDQVAAALRRPAGSPKRLILVDGTGTWARPLSLYLPKTWWLRGRTVRTSEIDVIRRLPGETCPIPAWWGPACGLPVKPAPHQGLAARGFHIAGTQDVAGFQLIRWTAPRPVRVHGPTAGGARLLLNPTKAPRLP
jgi:mannosyltransferase